MLYLRKSSGLSLLEEALQFLLMSIFVNIGMWFERFVIIVTSTP